jgi:hypothetical protein
MISNTTQNGVSRVIGKTTEALMQTKQGRNHINSLFVIEALTY